MFNIFLKLLLVEEKTINLKANQILTVAVGSHLKETNISHSCIVMQEASDAHSKTADSDTVSHSLLHF